MKKHVLWFDYILKDRASEVFLYVMNVCMKKRVGFNAIHGSFKGRLEFECEDSVWDALVTGCWRFYDYTLIDESL